MRFARTSAKEGVEVVVVEEAEAVVGVEWMTVGHPAAETVVGVPAAVV